MLPDTAKKTELAAMWCIRIIMQLTSGHNSALGLGSKLPCEIEGAQQSFLETLAVELVEISEREQVSLTTSGEQKHK